MFARKRGAAAGKKGRGKIGEAGVKLRSGGPPCRGDGGDDETVGSVTDGRLKKIGKGEFAEPAGE